LNLIDNYIPVIIFIIVGISFPLGSLILSRLIRPTIKNPEKFTTYECGEIPIGEAWHQYNIQYYMYAILLVIFDVEVLFFYPWAVVYFDLGFQVLAAGLLFLLIVFIGLVYEWKKGVLAWAQ
jgi:NADH:ubiquinone oxidoreductase subunit 3 (subunit A)|tara:strand:+ start:134 stop:499 length:366 start_codon:yes stop_codon:yes gene_type:complete